MGLKINFFKVLFWDASSHNKVTPLLMPPLANYMGDLNSQVPLYFGYIKENSEISQNIDIIDATDLVCVVCVRNF